MIARLRAELARGAGRQPLPARRCRTSASAAARATRNTSTRCRPTTCRAAHVGAEARGSAAATCPSSPTSTPTSRDKGLQTALVIDRDDGGAPGHQPRADRQHAQRRLRPAAGLDDLQPAQPVPRRDGGGAASTGRTRTALRGHLRQHRGGPVRGTSVGRCRRASAGDAARNQRRTRSPGRRASTGAVSTTPRPWCRSRRSPLRPTNTPLAVNHQGQFVATTISFNLPQGVSLGDAAARSTRPWPDRRAGHDPRQLPGHRARVPGLAGEPAVADPGRAARRLHRARHPLREPTCTRSRSSRRCRRPASARCSR